MSGDIFVDSLYICGAIMIVSGTMIAVVTMYDMVRKILK